MEAIKPVVTEKNQFESRVQSILITVLMEISDNRDFDARININGFPTKSSSTGVRLSIETLIDEIKTIVAEKSQFEQRDILIRMALFRNFEIRGL